MADESMDQPHWEWDFGDVSADSASSYHESNYEDVLVNSREGSMVENPFAAEELEEDSYQSPFKPQRRVEDDNENSSDAHLRPEAMYRPNIVSEWSSRVESSLEESSDESGVRRADRYSTAARVKIIAPDIQRALPATEKFYSVNNIKGNNSNTSNDNSAPEADLELITMPEFIESAKKVHFKDLFRFTSTFNKMVLCFGVFCAICGGALIPFMPVIFGRFATSFLQVGTHAKPILSVLAQYTLYFVILASCEFVAIFIATFCFTRTGEQITRQMREEYLAALLRQPIDYFSRVGVGECTQRLTENINVIQKGISEKVARTIHALSTFTCAFAIAFYCNWKLAAELLWSVGVGLIIMGTGIYFSSSLNARISDANSRSASMAEEAISSMRNIKALNAEGRYAKRYMKAINEAAKWSVRQKIQVGASLGVTITVNYLNIALILWQGRRLIAHGNASFTDVFVIELVISQALYALIGIANHVETFSKALSAAKKVYQTIDRPSEFDATSDEGNTLGELRGIIKFDNVSFRYPSRPGVKVLSDIDLTFPAGQITALVGASGSGKTSFIDLILRLYDPQGGQVLLDSVSVSSLNLGWLRKQIGVVNQNPGLFDVSIGENIRYGLVGTPYAAESAEAQHNRVLIAANAANAHEFIEKLPDKYNFLVGDHGSKLSGGQKQRIAIARALVSNPKILVLDEATASLDSETETKIVANLEAEKASRTTIIVAHRLSTIKRADNIVVLEKGQVVERGTHELLMFEQGAYYKLVKAGQSLQQNVEPAKPHVTHNVRSSSVYSKPEDPLSSVHRPSHQSAMVSLDPSSKAEPLAEEGFDFTSGVELDTLDAEGKLGAPKFRLPVEPKNTVSELVRFAVGFNRSEKWLNVAGILCCFFAGAEEAVNAILFGMSTISLSLPPGQYGDMLSQVAMWAWTYFAFALFQLIVFGGQGIVLGISSERMIQRVKESAFHHALRQDVAFYDASKSSTSTMVSLLTTETKNMCGLSGFTLGNLMIVASTLFSAVFIAICFGWKLALVCTATLPIVLGCGFLSVAFLGQHSEATSSKILAAANSATEALSEIRTVLILTRESEVLKQYCNALAELEKKSLWTGLKVSLVYAVCQSVVYLCMALGFWFGGTLIAKGEYSPLQFFIAFTSVIFGARSAGYFFSFADDMAKAIKGTALVKELLERKVRLDIYSKEGIRIHSKLMGALQFVNVSFRYPGRQEFVLKNLSFSIMPLEKVAIVGPSGGGKSTIINLIERFYDPPSGSVLMDGEHINSKSLTDYRSQLALVSQDVDLYEGTIHDNIILGSGEVPSPWFRKQVLKAVDRANLTEFVESLPEGLETNIGAKGCMLSGGQKQRIAIARALIRNPALLLLDEATSALDAGAENAVQRALDGATKGRTTIIVAHRLNTIRNADRILFLEGGKIVENGKHDDLVAKNGRYAEFVRLQEMEAKPLAFD